MASITTLNPDNESDLLLSAEERLADGEIVAFPTETLYGLCVRGDDDGAIERLFEAKDRPSSKQLAIYLAEDMQLDGVPPAAQRLATAFWPGPLTLVLESGGGETVGYRCSSHPFINQLAARCPFPIVGSSANISGSPPLIDAESIADTFGDSLGLIVDGGQLCDNLPSSVVSVAIDDSVTLLREGSIPTADIQRVSRRRILFVCTGNTCRSPLAEAICRAKLKELGLEDSWDCQSAGIAASSGAAASGASVRVAALRSLDLSKHSSQPVTDTLLSESNIICTMTSHHCEVLVDWNGMIQERVRVLGGDEEIPDPFGADDAVYDICASSIERCVAQLLENL